MKLIGKGHYLPNTARKVLKVTDKKCNYSSINNGIIDNGADFEYLRLATQEEIENAQSIEVFMAEDFTVIVKNNKIYHKRDNCDITDYVKSIKKWFDSIPKILDDYTFSIMPEDITIIKTGCQFKRTTVKQWLDLANKLKND